MADENTLKQEAINQQMLRDPFIQARLKHNNLSNTSQPFDPASEAPISGVPSKQEVSNLGDLMDQPLQTEIGRIKNIRGFFNQLGLEGLADDLDISSKGRPFLITRLKERFGEDFLQNPVARRALEMFESVIREKENIPQAQDEKDKEEELLKQTEIGKRSLEALLKGL